MVSITLTTFLDFISASAGTPRLTQVQRAIDTYSKDYGRRYDFYRQFREALRDLAEHGRAATSLGDLLIGLPVKKVNRYEKLVDGYLNWLTSTSIGQTEWTDQKAAWTTPSAPGLEIKVNPELFVVMAGQRYVVKLYLKGQEPAQRTVDSALWIMQEALSDTSAIPAVLDVQRAKLHRRIPLNPSVHALAKSDAASFLVLWRELNGLRAA